MELNTTQRRQGHHDRSDLPRHGAGRVIIYFILLILLNAMLAVYAVYMLGLALAFNGHRSRAVRFR